MDQEEVNQLLAEIISIYAPGSGKKSAKWVASKLPMSSVEEEIFIGSLPDAAVKAAFVRCGMILKEGQGALCGVIPAGAMDMNPAFVIVWIENHVLHILAQAKEGLIKQHTAEKAIQKLRAALPLLESMEEKRIIDEKNI